MPEVDAASLVALIHDAPIRLVLAITGGGSRAIAELLEVPGGSRTLLEAVVPYSSKALEDWLGSAPEQFCSSRTARAMAMAAYSRGRELLARESAAAQESRPTLVGVGCTASLVSDRPKRGRIASMSPGRAGRRRRVIQLSWRRGGGIVSRRRR